MTPLARGAAEGDVPWTIYRRALDVPLAVDVVERFAARLGTPSLRDGDRAAWPVRPRKAHGTFSETDGEARLHTDSQYHRLPERAFILACERPANDGGASILLDSREARHIAHDQLGMEGLRLLERPLWSWSVPDVFQRQGVPPVSPPAAVFAEDGSIRWRIDNIQCGSEELFQIARSFADALSGARQVVRVVLGAGDVLFCDNRFALHGRETFSDRERLLYRVRLS